MLASKFLAGLRYIWHNKLVLGAMSLDLFAVLLGGAVALLPVYAREILKVGAVGLGFMRSAPGVGALLMSVVVAHWPLRRKAGSRCSGVCSHSVCSRWFSAFREIPFFRWHVALVRGADTVSVIVRSTMIQLSTPDADARPRERGKHGVHRRVE